MRNNLETYVSLTSSSGYIWKVEWTAIGDVLFLKNGRKEFVDAHSLKENDLRVINYILALRFDVSVFDSQSSCEKESSFYIKGCEHTDVSSGSRAKKHLAISNNKQMVFLRLGLLKQLKN